MQETAIPQGATKVRGYAAVDAKSPLQPFEFERRALRANDVRIRVLYSGVCHSDVHVARNEWKNSVYPTVPGHEIVGRVDAIGADVKKYKVGDIVGVGCMVDSCQECDACKSGLEQHCENVMTQTYNDKDRVDKTPTQGGYSESIVVREEFVLRIPDNLDRKAVAPLLCAGVTTYSPMCQHGVGKKTRMAIVGMGGLGHTALKLAKALGANVTMITNRTDKQADARRMGADATLNADDDAAMKACAKSFDFILDTIPTSHDLNPLFTLLKVGGDLTIVGCLEPIKPPIDGMAFISSRANLSGSLIGGIPETQKVLDFCAQHNIVPDIELIDITQVNDAFDRMVAGDVRYRCVIDMTSPALATS